MTADPSSPARTSPPARPPRSPRVDIPLTFNSASQHWFNEIRGWARARGCALADVDDVASEVLQVAWRKREDFDAQHPAPWLYVTLRNKMSNYHGGLWRRMRSAFVGTVELNVIVSPDENPEQRALQKEQLQWSERAINQLSEKRRVVLVLREIEGYTFAEIATILGEKEDTVTSRWHQAVKQLREMGRRTWKREAA